MFWSKDYVKIKDEEFYIQLKPRLKMEVDEIWFQPIYKNFYGFFKNLELGFKREIVHHLTFEDFRIFPPFTDVYKENKRFFADKQRNILLEQGKIPNKIYFITSGEAYAGNSTGRYVYFKLPDGAYFGDSHILAGLPLSYSYFYDEKIGWSALTIDTKQFLKIWNKYPDSFTKIRENAEK